MSAPQNASGRVAHAMKSENILAIILAFLGLYLTYLILVPFVIPIFWATALVILFYPYYIWLLKKFGNRPMAASLAACASIALFIMIPLMIIGAAMANELVGLYHWAEAYMNEVSGRAHQSPLFFFSKFEGFIGRYVDISGVDLRGFFASAVREAAGFAGEGLRGFIKSFAGFLFNIILAFFAMFFLFKDGDKVLTLIKDLLPLSETDKEMVVERNRSVIASTLYGGVFVALIQGLLGGLAFWAIGLQAAIVWGFVMFFFSFIPTVGSAIVWLPAAAYLLITGHYAAGAGLILWGVFVIGLVDNLLRPFIVSGKTNLHPLLLFFSILGAVHVFGFIGIIAGPLILCIGQTAIEIYLDHVRQKNIWPG